MEMTKSVNVLVTGVGGGTIGEQVCKSLKKGENQYKLFVTNTSPEPMAVIQADFYKILPNAGDKKYISALRDLIKLHEIHFLIPGSELELIKISKKRNDLEDTGVKILINSNDVISLCVDKEKTFSFLSNNNIRVPKTLEVRNSHEIRGQNIEFPCIVKPSKGSGGSAATFIAQQMDELEFFVKYLLRYQYSPLIQEYIGNAGDEYTIGVLNSPNGKHMGTFVLNRDILSGLSNRFRVPNFTDRKSLGNILAISSGISQGRHMEFMAIKEQAENIAKILGSIGPLNIQGRLDGTDFIPFEINPRFSGTSPIRAMAGFNEPEILINWYLGKKECDNQQFKYGEFTRGLVEYFTPHE
jgi:carbamoyl-phosphate synthase large subunit